MRIDGLPKWLPPLLILAGIVLLITGLVSFFSAPSASSTLTQPPAAAAPSTSPLPTPAAISPLPTPTLPPPTPTSLPPTPTSSPTVPPTPTSTLASDSASTFNGDSAYQYVLAQTAIGPRPTGSEAGWATGDYIIAELEKLNLPVETQEFVFNEVKGRNVVARLGSGPIIIVGAHYDTRPAADQDPDPVRRGDWIEGANDGASGVAVLLELAQVLETDKLKNEIWLSFFDAEDRGRLDDWPFSVGARQMAGNLTVNPQSMVLVDMIGDADQAIYFETNSNPALMQEIWAVAAGLGYQDHFIPQPKHTLIDDHLPFIERGIPAVDIIDFDYPYWHTTADTADKVSSDSLERVGRTLEVWLEEKQ